MRTVPRARFVRKDCRSQRFATDSVASSIFVRLARLRRAERATLRPWTRRASFRLDRHLVAFEATYSEPFTVDEILANAAGAR